MNRIVATRATATGGYGGTAHIAPTQISAVFPFVGTIVRGSIPGETDGRGRSSSPAGNVRSRVAPPIPIRSERFLFLFRADIGQTLLSEVRYADRNRLADTVTRFAMLRLGARLALCVRREYAYSAFLDTTLAADEVVGGVDDRDNNDSADSV